MNHIIYTVYVLLTQKTLFVVHKKYDFLEIKTSKDSMKTLIHTHNEIKHSVLKRLRKVYIML